MMNNTSIVLELQSLSTDGTKSISELLRKALLVSSKLSLSEFSVWIKRELDGYSEIEDLPKYRKIFAHLQGQNPVRGLIPIHVTDPKLSEIVNTAYVFDSAESLEGLLKSESQTFHLHIPDPLQPMLMQLQRSQIKFRTIHTVSRSQIVALTGAIRDKILHWTIELEQNGILGSGLTFSGEEKRKAMSNQNINIQNFQGNIGDITNSEVSQKLEMKIIKNDYEGLSKLLYQNGVHADDVKILKEAIEADVAPTIPGKFGPKVSGWIGQMLQKAASGIWQIGLGAAGNLLADGINKYYGL